MSKITPTEITTTSATIDSLAALFAYASCHTGYLLSGEPFGDDATARADREAIRANVRAFLDRRLPFAYTVASDDELRHLGATVDDPFLAAELGKRGLQISPNTSRI